METINYTGLYNYEMYTNKTTVQTADLSDVMKILQMVIAVVGIISNFTVIFAFLNHKQLRKKIPNMFIIHQSIIDFFASIILLMSSFTLEDTSKVRRGGILRQLECRLWNTEYFLWALFFASGWNIVGMTIERYLELVHPTWHRANFKTRWVYTTFALIWLCNIIFKSYLIPTSKVVADVCYIYHFWPSPLFKSIWGVVNITYSFFIPLLIMVYCYGRIAWVLTTRIDSKLSSSGSNDTFHVARTNTIKTLLTVALCFVICWSRNQIYYLMYNLGYEADFKSIFFNFTVIMGVINSIVNPFIYLIKYKDYQEALRHWLCRKKQDLQKVSLSTLSSEISVTSMKMILTGLSVVLFLVLDEMGAIALFLLVQNKLSRLDKIVYQSEQA